jgi:hypothetical protein
LRVHPVHHRDVTRAELGVLVALVRATREVRAASADQCLHLAGDPLGLLVFVVGLEALDLETALDVGPQLLVLASRVVRDHGMRGVEDELGRAIVALELHDRRVRPVALEVEDVAQVGATPRIDRLVVVADHREVAALPGERVDP